MFSSTQSRTLFTITGSMTSSAKIIDPAAVPYYWHHECLNSTQVYTLLEEGTIPADLQTYSSPSSSSSSFSSPLSMPSPSSPQVQNTNNTNSWTLRPCDKCGYTPRYNTILTNESHQPVETLTGRNLLADRFVQYIVRCGYCRQTTKNYLPAHSMYNKQAVDLIFLGDEQCNNCWHYHIKNSDHLGGLDSGYPDNGRPSSAELTCRSCTIVNPFGEDFMMFLGHGAIVGGPLHRHLVATKMELEIHSMQHNTNQGIRGGGSDTSGAAVGGKKRKTELAGLEQGVEEKPLRRGSS
ncbi:hypothetical protein QBC37DRAFT_393033 [Rhypophila decipiens]|uniref:Uncharacterized protein n=1 Tax=Rhypophila decipiens TaxID=261697 RepID=A0AAN6XUG1_9PEZI|nr:hypothetical protein QBC37DRAFT_393033 [Rhypophila decipiens]